MIFTYKDRIFFQYIIVFFHTPPQNLLLSMKIGQLRAVQRGQNLGIYFHNTPSDTCSQPHTHTSRICVSKLTAC